MIELSAFVCYSYAINHHRRRLSIARVAAVYIWRKEQIDAIEVFAYLLLQVKERFILMKGT